VYRAGIVELVGYRFWTESLGSDREWIIQTTQARIYNVLHKEFSNIGSFLYSLRYDYMVFIDGNSKPQKYINILNKARKVSPVPLRIAISCGKTPVEAQSKATRALLSMEVQGLLFDVPSKCRLSPIAAIHSDFNDFTGKIKEVSIYETYSELTKFYVRLKNFIMRNGGLTFYLGGDNFVSFLPVRKLNKAIKFLKEVPHLKSGIGVHKIPRRALTLATKALDEIRENRGNDKVKVLLFGENA